MAGAAQKFPLLAGSQMVLSEEIEVVVGKLKIGGLFGQFKGAVGGYCSEGLYAFGGKEGFKICGKMVIHKDGMNRKKGELNTDLCRPPLPESLRQEQDSGE